MKSLTQRCPCLRYLPLDIFQQFQLSALINRILPELVFQADFWCTVVAERSG